MGKSKYDNFYQRLLTWIGISGGNLSDVLRDIETLDYKSFNTEYGTNRGSEKSFQLMISKMKLNLNRIRSKDIIYKNVKLYSKNLDSSLKIRKKPKIPPIPIPKVNWKSLFAKHSPHFKNEKVKGVLSPSGEVGFYRDYRGYLRHFTGFTDKTGRKITGDGVKLIPQFVQIVNNLIAYFKGIPISKTVGGMGIKIRLECFGDGTFFMGKVFMSFTDFKLNFPDWLDSLITRIRIQESSYSTKFIDVFLQNIRITTYIKSTVKDLQKEKNKRFSLYLRYL